MVNLVVCDMAGTTIDDRDEVYRVLRAATERFGASYPDETFQQWMGTEKKWAIRNLLELGGVDVDEELVEKAWQWFRGELARTYTEQPPTPLPGVEAALRRLRAGGVKVGLTTGFSREIVDLILNAMGWTCGDSSDDTVDAVAAGDEVEAGRPEPFLIQAVMAATGVDDPAQVVSAGDTEADVRSAQNAGVRSVGVLTGHLSVGDFHTLGADVVLDSVADLPAELGLEEDRA